MSRSKSSIVQIPVTYWTHRCHRPMSLPFAPVSSTRPRIPNLLRTHFHMPCGPSLGTMSRLCASVLLDRQLRFLPNPSYRVRRTLSLLIVANIASPTTPPQGVLTSLEALGR